MTTSEERKQAKIAISIALIGTAAGLLPILAAIVTFVIDSRVAGLAFWILSVLSLCAYVTCIVFGGLGIEKTAKGDKHGYFNGQAVMLLLGTGMLIIAFARTGHKEDKVDPQMAVLQASALATREEIGQLKQQVLDLQAEVNKKSQAPSPPPCKMHCPKNGKRR